MKGQGLMFISYKHTPFDVFSTHFKTTEKEINKWKRVHEAKYEMIGNFV